MELELGFKVFLTVCLCLAFALGLGYSCRSR